MVMTYLNNNKIFFRRPWLVSCPTCPLLAPTSWYVRCPRCPPGPGPCPTLSPPWHCTRTRGHPRSGGGPGRQYSWAVPALTWSLHPTEPSSLTLNGSNLEPGHCWSWMKFKMLSLQGLQTRSGPWSVWDRPKELWWCLASWKKLQ